MGAGDDHLDGDGELCEDGGVPVRRLPVVLLEAEEASEASADPHWREAVRVSGTSSASDFKISVVLDETHLVF